ncbi:DUF5709 domain-containing protein [Sphaerisporangium sp. TRM90804]|uniref:DUF5709 domain-containing protein n=1 Tax=Sphaerisporangium sp. TRM90804 TaxID=3031113 RepID=UPI00244D728F|nr:DUF5709 domain-containing protein [Sphaerisporangium sp. TRM90804]MDH2425458.1 DUF5709 domain-containing protein [Sphaerisporangium sp. TRM90804]
MTEHDPRSRFEDEGIPDLQDGTPQQQWAVDPQEAPLPGDRPVAVDDFGTTAEEHFQGEPLDGRLDREVPEEQPVFGVDATPAGDEGELDLDTGAQPEEPSGTVWEDPRSAGRLVAPDEGAHADTEAAAIADEVGPDGGGYTAEEAAMRVEPE